MSRARRSYLVAALVPVLLAAAACGGNPAAPSQAERSTATADGAEEPAPESTPEATQPEPVPGVFTPDQVTELMLTDEFLGNYGVVGLGVGPDTSVSSVSERADDWAAQVSAGPEQSGRFPGDEDSYEFVGDPDSCAQLRFRRSLVHAPDFAPGADSGERAFRNGNSDQPRQLSQAARVFPSEEAAQAYLADLASWVDGCEQDARVEDDGTRYVDYYESYEFDVPATIEAMGIFSDGPEASFPTLSGYFRMSNAVVLLDFASQSYTEGQHETLKDALVQRLETTAASAN